MATQQNASEKITEYINKQPSWSKAICEKLRSTILAADKSIVEDWKWGPHYKTEQGMVAGFASFKKHVKLNFFNGVAIKDEYKLFNADSENEFSRAFDMFDEKDINEKAITDYVKQSVEINKKGFKRVTKEENKVLEIPEELTKALSQSKLAKQNFEAMPYSHKKEYVQWIQSAKRDETKNARIKKAIEMIEGKKGLNDKYKK